MQRGNESFRKERGYGSDARVQRFQHVVCQRFCSCGAEAASVELVGAAVMDSNGCGFCKDSTVAAIMREYAFRRECVVVGRE